jgi:hypothetical protein
MTSPPGTGEPDVGMVIEPEEPEGAVKFPNRMGMVGSSTTGVRGGNEGGSRAKVLTPPIKKTNKRYVIRFHIINLFF